MKAITHNLFSAGVAFYLLSRIGLSPLLGFLLAIWLSLAINWLIDLGHSRKEGTPARSFVTHSVFTAPIWGGMIGAASTLAPSLAVNFGANFTVMLIGVTGVMISYSHLLLDALTQAGVFLGRHRIAIAHFGYDNAGLNLVFAMIGIILLVSPFL